MKDHPKIIQAAGLTLWLLFTFGIMAMVGGCLWGAPPPHALSPDGSIASTPLRQSTQADAITTDTMRTTSTLNASTLNSTTATIKATPTKKPRPAAYGPEIPPPPIRRAGMELESQICAECHLEVTPYFEADAHKAADFFCVTCHGPSETHKVKETLDAMPNNTWRRWLEDGWMWRKEKATLEIALFCASCHDFKPAKKLKIKGIPWEGYILTRHGQGVLRGSKDAPTCTDCHAGHGVYAATWELDEITEACAVCHADMEKMTRAGLNSNVIEDFKMGVHGGLSTLPSDHNSSCIDCHPPHI